jgi:hypothetical protein
VLYLRLRAAFPDFRPEIHWQAAAGDLERELIVYSFPVPGLGSLIQEGRRRRQSSASYGPGRHAELRRQF